MKRVTGIGGIFFKAKDPAAQQAWYREHLGIDVLDWGGAAFSWADADGKPTGGTTVWSVGAVPDDYYAPSTAAFMINYRVADLHGLLAALRAEGCAVLEKVEESSLGKFGWVMDPEFAEKLLWGGKVVGLRVALAAAPPATVRRLVRQAWANKAPGALKVAADTAR